MGHPVYTGPQVARILAIIDGACGGNRGQVQRVINSGALYRVFRGNYGNNCEKFDCGLLEEALGLRPRRPEQIVVASAPHLLVWATAKLGKTVAEWLAFLEANGNSALDPVEDVMGKPAFAARTEEIEVELVRAEVRDLGFTNHKNLPTTDQILARAELFGFTVDEPQAGPAACLAAGEDDQFSVLHRPIVDSSDNPYVFSTDRYGAKPCLSTYYARPGSQWKLERELVLVRRKPTQGNSAVA